MKSLNKEDFLKKVFDFETNKEFKFEGNKPAILDFSADWCGPCKVVGPILEELSEEYSEKINVYKIDIDEQMELATNFGIRSVPSILFIPMEGSPKMLVGALPKKTFEEVIRTFLKVE